MCIQFKRNYELCEHSYISINKKVFGKLKKKKKNLYEYI